MHAAVLAGAAPGHRWCYCGCVLPALTLVPIGVIHTPFPDRVSAPRQTYVARDVEGTIVLDPGRGFEHALADLEGWEYLWVLYWFHLNEGWRPKVLPPAPGCAAGCSRRARRTALARSA